VGSFCFCSTFAKNCFSRQVLIFFSKIKLLFSFSELSLSLSTTFSKKIVLPNFFVFEKKIFIGKGTL